jgi:hypothetical protein
MGLFGSRYPIVLQAVMNHAQRLRTFLEERERAARPGDLALPWLTGRAGEVQCVVALVALDWHHQRLSGEEASAKLARYIKDLHDGLAIHLDVGLPPCCGVLLSGRRAAPPKTTAPIPPA